MKDVNSILNKSKFSMFLVFIFLLPFFFLPILRDFVILSKFYLLIYFTIATLLVSFVGLVISKKIHWTPHPFSQAFVLIILSLVLSTILMSPNKIQALYNPHFGVLMFLSFIILNLVVYNQFSAQNKNKAGLEKALGLSGVVVSMFALVSGLNAFANVTFPDYFSFLKNPFFNAFGTSLELILFQIFVLVMLVGSLFGKREVQEVHGNVSKTQFSKFLMILSVLIAVGLVFQLYQVVQSLFFQGGQFILPPFGVSWISAIEVLKNPLTAVFGVGVDNFTSIFTRAKSAGYNTSDLWQVSSFATSRSTLLHILTETGLLGLTAFGILFFRIINNLRKVSLVSRIVMVYSLILLAVFPPTFVIWFMFFVALMFFSFDLHAHRHAATYEVNLENLLPIYIGIVVISLLLIAGATYHVSQIARSEFFFKRAADEAQRNNLKGLYDNQLKAVNSNLYNEDFRISFSRTNMILALNVASKNPEEITDQDRQIIAQAIQAAIAEAKAAVALNPNKASNWHYLGTVYKDIINVAQGAETWTVTAYQQSILLDPQNPTYRLNLGGIFYLFQNFDAAQRLFEQSASLKPDWANAYYNLAWTLYQKKDYGNAILAMEQVLKLVNPQTEKADYDKATAELEEFRKSIPQQAEQAPAAVPAPEQLVLPSPPAATVEPKLSLPPEASPEAN